MKLTRNEYIIIGIVLLAAVVSIVAAPYMPEQMPIHWNAAGQVDDYMSKNGALTLLPLMMAGVALVFLIIPRIDPLRRNLKSFRSYFDGFIILMMLFFLLLHGLTIAWGGGVRFDMSVVMILAFAVISFYIGILMQHAKRNWFVGIRTPWTLSHDSVWEKTHMRAAVWYKAAAIIMLVSLLLNPLWRIYIVIGLLLLISFAAVLYSYILYRRLER